MTNAAMTTPMDASLPLPDAIISGTLPPITVNGTAAAITMNTMLAVFKLPSQAMSD